MISQVETNLATMPKRNKQTTAATTTTVGINRRGLPVLGAIAHSSPRLRKAILSNATIGTINDIGECCLNTLSGNVKLSASDRAQLRRYRNYIRRVGSRQVSAKKRRQLLIQRGGNFLPILLPLALTVVERLVSRLRN